MSESASPSSPAPGRAWPPEALADPRDQRDSHALRVPPQHDDPGWQRPVRARYVDPLELVWLATLHRFGLRLRRDPAIYSMTDGQGLLALSTRDDLDADDSLAQMALHEICHWITNGADSFEQRDWGFPLWDQIDVREHGCLRLQAWLADAHGLRAFYAPTSGFRQYYDKLPPDPLQPLDDTEWEAAAVRIARDAARRARLPLWWGPLQAALAATAGIRQNVRPFLADYRSEHEGDALPPLWAADPGR